MAFITSLFKKKGQLEDESPVDEHDSHLFAGTQGENQRPMMFGLATVFSYKVLKKATNNFHDSRVLGGGGFGRVYLGKLQNGKEVAVKKLYEDNPKQLEQFFNEVSVLSRIRHPNLVALYGCTSPRGRKKLLLVYEFVPNGTVADHLYGQLVYLPWTVRILIAIQTAEVLAYLHSLGPPIIHRDVKTSNILLDNNFNVKVADLGLCRLLPWDATYVSTAPQGTVGYRDPEYDLLCKLTEKSDVYSFGVMLLELLSGKQAVDVERETSEIYLTRMAFNKISNNLLEQLVDPKLGYHSDWEITSTIDSVIELACKCLQPQGSMRPSMMEVCMALKGLRDTPKAEEVMLFGLDNFLSESDTEMGEITEGYDPSQVSSNDNFITYQVNLRGGVIVKVLKEGNPRRQEECYKIVSSLSCFRHRNIIGFYGCTIRPNRELLLVYEHLPNDTLAYHLSEPQRWTFSLDRRIQIAIDTAEALAYLQSLNPPVVHGGVTTDNILLDNNFNAKIVDLSLCHLLRLKAAEMSTATQGTLICQKANYEKHINILRTKWDVYCFGRVLMELMSYNYKCKSLISIKRHYEAEPPSFKLVDRELWAEQLISRGARLASCCLQRDEMQRPHMVKVLSVLKEIKSDHEEVKPLLGEFLQEYARQLNLN